MVILIVLVIILSSAAPRTAPIGSGRDVEWEPSGASSGDPQPAVAAPLAVIPPLATLGGWATWYEDPRKSGLYAAAGPALRRGDWRGSDVTVCARSCVTVRLSDWCACGARRGTPTLIDLSPAAFRRLAPLSAGVVRVTIGAPRATPTGPPTDVGP